MLFGHAQLNEIGGRPDQAAALYRRSLGIWEKTGLERIEAARTLHALALIAEQQRRLGEAESYYARALPIWEKVLGAEHSSVAATVTSLAHVVRLQGALPTPSLTIAAPSR
ncbi:MAG: tetratricopeptide repeat protein [Rhodospirillales bacterium]|nr:tetratricopeptide repeat protein [Rhodospirillales bacterium]